jgi:porin
MVSGDQKPGGLPGVYKIGAWFDTAPYQSQQYDNTGLSLANPNSNGDPLAHHGQYGFYATADQMIWVDPTESDRNVNVFGRVLWAPQADRNLLTFSMNAGLTVHEPFMHRDDDTFAVGMGYAKVSSGAAGLDKATGFYTGAYVPVRGGETYIELSYQYQVTPWWQLQPDIQYVFNPGGGIADPNAPNQRVGDELVLGLRTTIQF